MEDEFIAFVDGKISSFTTSNSSSISTKIGYVWLFI